MTLSRPRGERACDILAAAQHGVLARGQAVACGMSERMIDRRLEQARWIPLHPRVYAVGGAPRSRQRDAMAACLYGGRGAAASHRLAAELLNLAGVAGRIEISTPQRLRRRGIVVHGERPVPVGDITHVGSIPVTTAARTLIDLGAVVPAGAVEVALEDALHRGLVSVASLAARLCELGGRGRNGTGVLRKILERRAAGAAPAESILESRLIRVLVADGLPAPTRQHLVRRRGVPVARVDLAYPEVRLALEADGHAWHSKRSAWERDLARNNALQQLGWRVLRFTWTDVVDRPRATADQVRRCLNDLSARRYPPYASADVGRTRVRESGAPL